jgi:hypothetical protein
MAEETDDSKTNSKRVKKPTEKKTFSIDKFTEQFKGGFELNDKQLQWYILADAFQKEVGLPGFPMGYVSLVRGYSNTGKSTAIMEAIIDAQRKGHFVVIIDTENNLGKVRLKLMGFDESKKNYLYINNDFLLENYGKVRNPEIRQACIEDMAEFIHDILDEQESGGLPFNILFAIDSLGTLDCLRSVKAMEAETSDNNMWNAGAFEKHFKPIINNRIPATRKENKPYYASMVAVQKIWFDAMSGAGTIKHKGGEAFFYGARLIYHFGGIQSHGTAKVKATSKGRDVAFGIEAKVGIVKNQVDGPLGGIAFDGKIISTPHGFISSDKEAINEYKKKNILYFRDQLGVEDSDEIQTDIDTSTLDFLNES